MLTSAEPMSKLASIQTKLPNGKERMYGCREKHNKIQIKMSQSQGRKLPTKDPHMQIVGLRTPNHCSQGWAETQRSCTTTCISCLSTPISHACFAARVPAYARSTGRKSIVQTTKLGSQAWLTVCHKAGVYMPNQKKNQEIKPFNAPQAGSSCPGPLKITRTPALRSAGSQLHRFSIARAGTAMSCCTPHRDSAG